MAKENRCPACGPVRDESSSRYCPTHRQELLSECERYLADWAATEVARIRMPKAA